MTSNKTEFDMAGTINESYHYSMDGEYISGYNEINVIVTDIWKSGENKGQAKEVKTNNNLYYRQTTQNGWRKYCKTYKTFTPKKYTGSSINFTPNRLAEETNNYSRINLGSY